MRMTERELLMLQEAEKIGTKLLAIGRHGEGHESPSE